MGFKALHGIEATTSNANPVGQEAQQLTTKMKQWQMPDGTKGQATASKRLSKTQRRKGSSLHAMVQCRQCHLYVRYAPELDSATTAVSQSFHKDTSALEQ